MLGFGMVLTTEYCRVPDTRPNRVAEPSIGSALQSRCLVQILNPSKCFLLGILGTIYCFLMAEKVEDIIHIAK